jgi:subtilisin family serine protease
LSGGNALYTDWVLVRKYVSPEPAATGWGNEVDTEGPTTYTATRDILYRIKTENRTATRDIGYAIPSGADTYTTTRDIAYKIESTYTTERDIQYRMAGESATTRKVTRSIHYHIAGQPSERFPDYTYTGTDVIVCIIDTGIDVAHPDLNDVEIVDWENYISGHDHLNDGSGHGTMVTSLLCGRARASPSGTRWNGIAPGVRLLFARVETDAGVIQSASVPTAFQWAVDNGAKIISWSSGEYAEHLPWKQAVEDARADGVLCVIAAGNANGQPDTTSEPAYRDAATAAGGLLENNTTIWGMSGRGPGENDITKPDLVWQAENVRAARPSNIQPPNSIIVDDYYCRGSGTSFSTPVIAGRISALQKEVDAAPDAAKAALRARLAETMRAVRSEKLGEVAEEFDHIHSVHRALQMGSLDRIIKASDLRPYLVDAIERGIARYLQATGGTVVGA